MKTETPERTPLSKNRGASKGVRSGTLVRGLRAQIEELKRDAARLDWLQKNFHHELTIEDGWDEQANAARLLRWKRKYVSYHEFCGRNVRGAIDEAIRQDP